MSDSTAEQRALRHDVGAVWFERDFVTVTGPDSLSFLQGQLSQNVDLPTGGSAWSLLLQPQGKMVALVRVSRFADDEFVLDTDSGWADVVIERLNRFKLRVKADIGRREWRCLGLRGAKAHDVSVADVALPADWPGLLGVDVVGVSPILPHGVPLCSAEAYEAVRIEAGIPKMGAEIDERVIPAEAGIVEQSVSFTKGCYTGQELVARIDSRGGNVPRHLRGIVMSDDVVPPAGAVVRVAGKEVGSLTSVARSVELHAPVALAFVGRAVSPPDEAVVEWDGGSSAARVESLPLVS